ncbi:MAG: DUF2892 domain-containing protein [Melioribacteraceae bacterium]|jgi:predicted RND superfamily exporter protein|nr:DUF2892 domain-containing protein [Melioribacteraceae bacterium]RJP61269.1 MAG: DUF2892 domain-containing protein [Ignavibacteriales bacterium]WKZ68220.1 MAG: DUF2892 domain-containing protein [Melioribacteraceae bacterium]
MKENVGGFDKYLRIAIGVVILIVGYIYESWWGLIGIIPLLTGLVNRCGLYYLIGASTCKTSDSKK